MNPAAFHPACPCCEARLPNDRIFKCPRCRRSLPGPAAGELIQTWLLEVFLPTSLITGFILYAIVALLTAMFGHSLVM